MEIRATPYNTELTECLSTIENLKNQLEEAYNKKNTLLKIMANFYTNQFQNAYVEKRDNGRIGQMEYIFYDGEKFFVRLYMIDVTEKSKLTKKKYDIELFGEEMKNMNLLTESEFKDKFFEYVTNRIKVINMV